MTISINLCLQELTNKDQDTDVVTLVRNALEHGKQIDHKTFQILCAHDKCRHKTLRVLLNHFLRHNTREALQKPLQMALFQFVHGKHYQERPSQLARVVNLFRLYGANFFQKNHHRKDAFDYAHNTGNHFILDSMLRLSPTNPIRKIRVLLRRERRHPSRRDYMMDFLTNVRHEFTTEKGFLQGRIYSPFLPSFQPNL